VGSILRVENIRSLFEVFLYVKVRQLNNYQRSDNKRQRLIVKEEPPNPKPRFIFLINLLPLLDQLLFANLHTTPYKQAPKRYCAENEGPKIDVSQRLLQINKSEEA
jgi:hypothetical protein